RTYRHGRPGNQHNHVSEWLEPPAWAGSGCPVPMSCARRCSCVAAPVWVVVGAVVEVGTHNGASPLPNGIAEVVALTLPPRKVNLAGLVVHHVQWTHEKRGLVYRWHGLDLVG